MRLLTFLSSTAIATALITSTVMVTDARAQKGQVLDPATDWAITQVDDQAGTGGYCALARRFKQDTVLTLARNGSSETSFALDFQRPKLDTSKIMSVTLDPGAGQQRVYDVRPVSNQAFVVRLGSDAAFFAALEKTGHLRVEAGTQSYSFNLADIDTGQFRLDSCIAAMVAPAAGDEAPDAGGGVIAQGEAKTFKQDVNGLRRQIQELKEENLKLTGMLEQGSPVTPMPSDVNAEADAAATMALSVRLSELEKENQTLKSDITRLKTSNNLTTIRANPVDQIDDAPAADTAAVQAEIAALKTENAKLKDIAAAGGDSTQMLAKLAEENRRLQETLDAGGAATAATTDTAALTDKIAALEAQNEQLKASIATAAAESAGSVVADEQIAALKAENAGLQKSIAEKEASQVLTAEIEAQVAALKVKNEELTAQLALAQQASTASVDTKIAQYESENKNLKSMLDKKGVDAELLEQLRQKIGEMETENRLLQETAGKAQIDFETQKRAEIDALKTQLAAQQAQDASKAGGDVTKLQQEIAALSSQIEQKDAELLEASNAAVGIEELKTKNAELEAKIAAAATSTTAGATELATLEAKVISLEATNAGLKTELEKQAAAAATTQVASADIEKVKAELTQAQAERDALKAEIASAASSSTTELQTALAENETLKAQVAEAQTLSTKLGTLQKENDELKLAASTQATAGTELAASQEAVKAMVAENEQLKTKVASLEAAAPAADQSAQLASLQEENKKTAAALEKALADALDYQNQITEKDKQLASAQQEKQELVASLEQKGGEHANLATLQTQMEGLKTENQTLLMRVAELEKVPPAPAVAAAETPAVAEPENLATISKLESDNATLKADLEKAQAELKSAAEVTPESQQRIADLERKLQQAEQKLAEAPKAAEPEPVKVADAPAPVAPVQEPEPQQAAAPEAEEPVAAEPSQAELAEASPAPAAPEPSKPEALVPEEPQQEQVQEQVVVQEQPVAEPVATEVTPIEVAANEAAAPADMPAAPPEAMIDGRPYSAAQAMEAKMARELEEQEALKAAKAEDAPAAEAQQPAQPPQETAAIQEEIVKEQLDQPTVAASMSEDPYEEIVAEAPEQVELMPEAAQPNPQVASVTPQASRINPINQPEPDSEDEDSERSHATPAAFNGSGVQTVIAAAQIAPESAVKRNDKASSNGKAVYQWNAENVYGSAEEQSLADAEQFDTHVKEYLEKTEQRCKGEFAIMPDNSVQQGDTRIDSYEIACVGGSVSSAAALIFYNNGGTFTAVAHEAPAENMDAAMNLRDRLIQTLSGSYQKQASLPQFTKRKDG